MKRVLTMSLVALMTLTTFNASAKKGYEFSTELLGSIGAYRIGNNYGGFNIINGWRITDKYFIGIGTGMEITDMLSSYTRYRNEAGKNSYIIERNPSWVFVPLTFSSQYFFNHESVRPFARIDAGYSLYVFRLQHEMSLPTFNKSGAFVEPSYGYDFKMKNSNHSLYALIGANFQYCKFKDYRVTATSDLNDSGYNADGTARQMNWLLPGISLRIGFRF